MATTPSNTVQVRVERLVRFYTCLAQALLESGLTGQQLNELFSNYIVAECLHCRIRVMGDEVEVIAVTDKDSRLTHPKLQRLRCGCCAREGCESSSYFVHFQNHSDVDWRAIAEKAFQLLTTMEIKERDQQKLTNGRVRKQKAKRLFVGVTVLMGLLLVRFVWHHGRLPLVHRTPKYEIDASFTVRTRGSDEIHTEAARGTF